MSETSKTVRDRRDPKAEVRSSEHFSLRPSDRLTRPASLARIPRYALRGTRPLPHPPPCYGGGKGGGTTNRHEHAG